MFYKQVRMRVREMENAQVSGSTDYWNLYRQSLKKTITKSNKQTMSTV